MPEWSGGGHRIAGSRCPRCGSELEYDGNYWCSQVACPYVMPDGAQMTRSDKVAFNIAYTLLMQERGEDLDVHVLYREVL